MLWRGDATIFPEIIVLSYPAGVARVAVCETEALRLRLRSVLMHFH